MSKSVENWLAANAPGDVRAFIAANQQRLTAQAETIAELRRDRARLAEILRPVVREIGLGEALLHPISTEQAREVHKLLTTDEKQ